MINDIITVYNELIKMIEQGKPRKVIAAKIVELFAARIKNDALPIIKKYMEDKGGAYNRRKFHLSEKALIALGGIVNQWWKFYKFKSTDLPKAIANTKQELEQLRVLANDLEKTLPILPMCNNPRADLNRAGGVFLGQVKNHLQYVELMYRGLSMEISRKSFSSGFTLQSIKNSFRWEIPIKAKHTGPLPDSMPVGCFLYVMDQIIQEADSRGEWTKKERANIIYDILNLPDFVPDPPKSRPVIESTICQTPNPTKINLLT